MIVTGELFNDVTPAHRYKGAGAITLVEQIIREGFREAVKWLQDRFGRPQEILGISAPPPRIDHLLSREQMPFELPPKCPDSDAVTKDWLVQRGLPDAWAEMLMKANDVYAEEYQGHYNIVFPMTDWDCKTPVACLRRGTAEPPGSPGAFKGKLGHGGVWSMSYASEGTSPTKVLIFESPLDAISHQVLHGEVQGRWYLTIGGLSGLDRLVESLRKALPSAKIVMAIDNDSAGDDAFKRLADVFPGLKRELPDRKDWNDDLRLGPLPNKVVDSWLSEHSASTQESYRKELDLFAQAHGLDLPTAVDRLLNGELSLDKYELALKARGLQRATVRKKVAIIHSLEVHAGTREPFDPAAKRPKPKPERPSPPATTPKCSLEKKKEAELAPAARTTLLPAAELRARTLFMSWIERPDIAVQTKATYEREMSLFGRWVSQREGRGDEGSPESGLAALLADKSLVLSYEEDLRDRGLAPKTINKKLAALSSVLTHATGIEGQVDLPRAPARTTPRSGPSVIAFGEAVKKLSRRASPEISRNKALLLLGGREGLRLEETRNIKLDDVDLAGCRVRITEKKSAHQPASSPKWIPIDAETTKALQECIETRPADAGTDFLFVARGNNKACAHMSRKAIHDMVKRQHIPRADGRGECSYHSLRHTAITSWLDAGTLEAEVTHRARWTSSRMLAVYDDINRIG